MSFLCRALTISRAGTDVLKSVDAEFQAGGVTAVVGPNGSGKSSLLKALYGYLPLQSGQLEFDGQALSSWEPRRLSERLGVCPQEAESSLDFQVSQCLALPFRGEVTRVESALEELPFLGLGRLLGKKLSELSGGERQRVRLGMALMRGAPWLVLDEPANHLDLSTAWSLFEFLKKPREGGVILALHDLETAARRCDHILVLRGGERVAMGSPAEVLTPELLREVFGLKGEMTWSDGTPSLRLEGVTEGE